MFDVFYIGIKPELFAHEREAHNIDDARRQSRTRYFWITTYLADYTDWNWLWEPPPWQANQCHVWPSQWQRNSGTMLLPRDPHSDVNYHTDCRLSMRASKDHWYVPDHIDPDSVDTSWHPDFDDAQWIYHFASQHQRSSGVTYACDGAAGIKFVDNMKVRSLEDRRHWQVPLWIDPDSIDYSWHPDSLQPAMIYHFATTQGWEKIGGPEYHQPGADRTCYSQEIVAETQGDINCWHIPDWIDPASIDRSWCPHPADPPLNYEFPVEWGWSRVGGPQYRVPGAIDIKYSDGFTARTRVSDSMHILDHISEDDAIRRWRPCPADPPYIYVFGNQWWPAEKRVSAEFHVPGATERKFMAAPRAQRMPDPTNFKTLVDCEFDWSWEPDPGDPPYIYVFGNQWWSSEKMPTVEYHVPGATERKFMAEPRAQLGTNPENHWHALEHCIWDASWRPDPGDPPYIYVFGNQWWPAEAWPTLEYRVPGATERKYVNHPRAQLPVDDANWLVTEGIDPESVDRSWRPDPGSPPYIYEFGTQWQKTGGARYTVPGATEIKYASAFRCHKTSHDAYWHMSEDLAAVIADFDWTWHPDATEEPYIYEFGTQHQKTGGPEYHVPGAVDRKYVDQVRVEVQRSRAAAVIIDHMDNNARAVHEQILRKVSVAKTVRYVNSYLDTLQRIAQQVDDEWIWITSSVCDYTDFDFTWYPEQWQATMLHVFASDDLKFGDTFFMHVPTFRERAGRARLLEWYDVNFVDRSVPRRSLPVINHQDDSHVEQIKNCDTKAPLVLFSAGNSDAGAVPAVNLWRPEVKAVTPLDQGACRCVVPREAFGIVKTQVYDYSVIDKNQSASVGQACDVIFISNGEPMAQDNFERLLLQCARAKHSQGVLGRERAYKAAASLSDTPWFYAVFAKTEVLPNFNFTFEPDRLQQPKHYIFHSRNPLNGLEYGAMNINLYNKRLVMDTKPGLDFTLSAPHEVVPILASISRFNTDPWVTWRSAFREVLKLKREVDLGADIEIQYRLKTWCNRAEGDNAEYCLLGARDAIEYYDQVAGNLDSLRNSFDWAWLQEYYFSRYQQKPWL